MIEPELFDDEPCVVPIIFAEKDFDGTAIGYLAVRTGRRRCGESNGGLGGSRQEISLQEATARVCCLLNSGGDQPRRGVAHVVSI